MPTKKARIIMPHSNAALCMILIPNKGKAGNNNGNKPQWIAHKIEVAIPNPSQFNLIFMSGKVMCFAILLQIACDLEIQIFNLFTFVSQ